MDPYTDLEYSAFNDPALVLRAMEEGFDEKMEVSLPEGMEVPSESIPAEAGAAPAAPAPPVAQPQPEAPAAPQPEAPAAPKPSAGAGAPDGLSNLISDKPAQQDSRADSLFKD